MLPRCERLTTRTFSQAFAQGRTWRHPLMQVRVAARRAPHHGIDKSAILGLAANEENVPRAAFVVAKKQAKAARRNRLRRQMRECYRLNPHRHNPKLHGLDLIFLAAPAALGSSPEALSDAMNQLLERTLRARPAILPRGENRR